MVLGRCSSFLRQRLVRAGDSDADVYRNVVTFTKTTVYAVVLLLAAAGGTHYPFFAWVVRLACAAFAALSAWVWWTKAVTPGTARVVTAASCLLITLTDFSQAPRFARYWPLFVLEVDYLLVIRAERWLCRGVVVYTCLWTGLIQLEESFRFGLFDTTGLIPYDDRRTMVDCEYPPCSTEERFGTTAAVLSLPGSYLPAITVFLLDFIFTRGFADQVAKERDTVRAAIRTTERVAKGLARYDLAEAERVLAAEEDGLPPELLAYFRELVGNLNMYRPFLPHEFFARAAAPRAPSPRAASQPGGIPGLVTQHAAIAFSDIRASTSLWECSTGDAMCAALATHNRVIRASVRDDGYEVKTVGDSFMVAFASALGAVRFGLSVQEALADDTLWPAGLARAAEGDGFKVLTVRLGIHCGEVNIEKNVLTGRYDYFGRAVNRAARVEPHGCPGAVTVTEEVRDAVGPAWAEVERAAWVWKFSDYREGKGLVEPLWLTTLLPRGVGYLRDAAAAHAAVLVRPPPSAGASRQSTPRSLVRMATQQLKSAGWKTACVGTVKFHFLAGGGGSSEEKADVFDLDEPVATPGSTSAWTDTPSLRLQQLHSFLVTTRGHLTSVSCNSALVSWGVHSACLQPINEAVRFLLDMYRAYAGGSASGRGQFCAGVALGDVRPARLSASDTQRFVTLVGPCVDASTALCHGASELRTCALVGALHASHRGQFHTNDFLQGHIRPVDVWELSLGRPMDVLELRLEALSHRDDVSVSESSGPFSGPGAASAGWSPAYWAAFRTGDADALERLHSEAGADVQLACVVDMLRHGRHLAHSLLRRWDTTQQESSETPVSILSMLDST